MQPAAKKRKIASSSSFAGAGSIFAELPNTGPREIPESPQEMPAATTGNMPKPTHPLPRSRFGHHPAHEQEQKLANPFKQNRFIQRPRFESSLSGKIGQMSVEPMKPASKVELRGKQHQSSDSTSRPESPSQKPRTKTKAKKRFGKYENLIEMALHEAPDHCLNVEEICEWIVKSVPGYDSKDLRWKDGVWVTLAVTKDFVKRGNGHWTFAEGTGEEYEAQNESTALPSTADLSSQDIQHDQDRVKQGDDQMTGHGSTERSLRADSETISTFPSMIDETLDIIDLTVEDEQQTRLIAPLKSSVEVAAEQPVSGTPPKRVNGAQRTEQRTSFAGFGEPTWAVRTSLPPYRKSETPLTDHILGNISTGQMTVLSRTEKWKAASRHVNNLLKSPLRAPEPTSIARGSTRGPSSDTPKPVITNLQALFLSPVISSGRDSFRHGLKQAESPVELASRDPDVEMQGVEPQHPTLELPDVAEQPDSAELDAMVPVASLQVLPTDSYDQGECDEQNLTRPGHQEGAQDSSEEVTLSQTTHAVQCKDPMPREPLLEKPLSKQPLVEELLPQEPQPNRPAPREPSPQKSLSNMSSRDAFLKGQPLSKSYADSAIQTDSLTTSVLALAKVSQISLEPRAAVEVELATVNKTTNSTTQTEPDFQVAHQNQVSPPEAQAIVGAEEVAVPSSPKTNGHDPEAEFDKERLALLEEMMYPTNPSIPRWPTHLEDTLPISSSYPPIEVSLDEIRARPTRKQIFGKVGLSRLANNDALTQLNAIKLGSQNIGNVNIHKGYTEEEVKEEKRLNEPEGYYDTLEEMLNMPPRVVPFIHEQQLAFRDFAPVSFEMGELRLEDGSLTFLCRMARARLEDRDRSIGLDLTRDDEVWSSAIKLRLTSGMALNYQRHDLQSPAEWLLGKALSLKHITNKKCRDH
ncbi:hypothetical protein E4T39_06398 [Aureobasidium subglaciale]|nr:hypothetical protein E4T39_06398 [Aureobasidium subglaciale]